MGRLMTIKSDLEPNNQSFSTVSITPVYVTDMQITKDNELYVLQIKFMHDICHIFFKSLIRAIREQNRIERSKNASLVRQYNAEIEEYKIQQKKWLLDSITRLIVENWNV